MENIRTKDVLDTLVYIQHHGSGKDVVAEINGTERRHYYNAYLYANARVADFTPCDPDSVALWIAHGTWWQSKMYEFGSDNLMFPNSGFNQPFINYLINDAEKPLDMFTGAIYGVHLSHFATKSIRLDKRRDVAALVDYYMSRNPNLTEKARIVAPKYKVDDANSTFEKLLETQRSLLFKKTPSEWRIKRLEDSTADSSIDSKLRLDSQASIKAEVAWEEADRLWDNEDLPTLLASQNWSFTSWLREPVKGKIIDRIRYYNRKKRVPDGEREQIEFFDKLNHEHPQSERVFDYHWQIPQKMDVEDIPEQEDEREAIETINRAANVKLTQRQREIRDLLADGYEPVQIAHKLKITESAVSQHIEAIRKKYKKEMDLWKK